MIKFTKLIQKSKLDLEIDALLDDMLKVSRIPEVHAEFDEVNKKYIYVTDDVYTAMIDNLEKLYKAKNVVESTKIDSKTALVVAGNILGIILVLKHEDLNVITSKALGFIIKGRA